jgi:hypothetical protein
MLLSLIVFEGKKEEEQSTILNFINDNIKKFKINNIRINVKLIQKNMFLPSVKAALSKNEVKKLPVLITPSTLYYDDNILSMLKQLISKQPIIKKAKKQPLPEEIDSVTAFRQEVLQSGDEGGDEEERSLADDIRAKSKGFEVGRKGRAPERAPDARDENSGDEDEIQEQPRQRAPQRRRDADDGENDNSRKSALIRRIEEDGGMDPDDQLMLDKLDL